MQGLPCILSFDSVTALRGYVTVERAKGKAMSARESDDKPGKKKSGQGMGREKAIYAKRFTEKEDRRRRRTWQALCRHFFQKYIAPEDTVLDIGAGDGLLDIERLCDALDKAGLAAAEFALQGDHRAIRDALHQGPGDLPGFFRAV